MLVTCLVSLALFGDTLVGPFKIADMSGHNQVSLRAAMAADGHFAIAWVDSFQLSNGPALFNICIRFFDKDGNPMTDVYEVPKTHDPSWVYYPSLDMDSLGNTVLVWVQDQHLSSTQLSKIRFQSFASDGTPVDSPKTLCSGVDLGFMGNVSLSNNGEFALAFTSNNGIWRDSTGDWVQKFNLSGVPVDSAFMPCESWESSLQTNDSLNAEHPRVTLNDAGDLVVTWLDFNYTSHMYPCYQAFDKNDKPIQPWEPEGYRVDDGDSLAGAYISHPHWLDNDRFVVFWTDYCVPPYWPLPLVGRVFSQKGKIKHPVRTLMFDSLYRVNFSTAVLSDGRFAETHGRQHGDVPHIWVHAGGILGRIVNDEPERTTTLFEYSPPYGADTIFTSWGGYLHYDFPPAVAADSDRIVWAYSRFNSDTIFEAWAVISDWDMGESSSETPVPITPHQFEIASPIGREIVLRFWDCPRGFKASVFDVSGRRVDELHSSQTSGAITWGECYGPGVYFIKTESGKTVKVQRVVLIK